MKKGAGHKLLDRKMKKQIYIELCQHPRFEKLDERVQDIIGELAAGATQGEIAKEQNVTRSMIWLLRNRAFYRLGFNITENGKTRVMRVIEVKEKMKL